MGTLDDPFDDPPWAMQLAARVEKTAPPSHSAVCEAAAMAVVRLLTDPRTEPEGEWHEYVRQWEDRRIRKVARRARGIRWENAQLVPGVTVDHAGAQVRAFVPGLMSEVPADLSKLQVAGLDLDDDEDPKPPPEPPYAMLALNPHVTMSSGKAAAQSGHASQLLLRQAGAAEVEAWVAGGLRVHLSRDVPWDDCVRHATVAVRDGGFTEVPPGTMTAIAWIAGG